MSESESASHKLWQGRSSGSLQDIMVDIGESISLDIKMYREDIYGSANHARMLHKIGILSDNELDEIIKGLRQVRSEIESGNLSLNKEIEDIHTLVENRLTELIGNCAKKLHTARSRNDQVALDTRLFVRRISSEIAFFLTELCQNILLRAGNETDKIVPGYTHLQAAQPIRLSHYLLAHFWTFLDDLKKFAWVDELSAQMPLGSGAFSGVNYNSDREYLCQSMNFIGVSPNSIEAVANRDHILNFLYACSGFALHASRIAEEVILWSTVEYGFVSLPDSLTTGSSIMPNKKNPDIAELVRGKAGRICSNLTNLLMNLKGLPFAYNRDLQEDRKPLIDSGEQTLLVVRSLIAIIRDLKFNYEKMRNALDNGFITATDLADALVSQKNIPFRDAHHIVGKVVAVCVAEGSSLHSVSREKRKKINEILADDDFYFTSIDIEKSADKKISYGGTALTQQKVQIAEATKQLKEWHNYQWYSTDLEV